MLDQSGASHLARLVGDAEPVWSLLLDQVWWRCWTSLVPLTWPGLVEMLDQSGDSHLARLVGDAEPVWSLSLDQV